MLQSHGLDNLEDECRQRKRDQEQRPDLLWLSSFRNGTNIIASVSKIPGIADSLEMDRIVIGQRRGIFAASGVKARNGKRSLRCSFVVFCPFQLTASHHTYHFINNHRFHPYQRSTTLRSHRSWLSTVMATANAA